MALLMVNLYNLKIMDLTKNYFRADGLPDCPLGRVFVFGIKLNSSGTHKPAAGGELRRWPRFALVYTLSGEAEYLDGHGNRATLTAGDLLFVFPGFPQSFFPQAKSKWNEIFIDLAGPALDPWLKSGVLDSQRPILKLTPVHYWARRIWEIQDCGKHPSAEESAVRIAMLLRLIADVVAAQAEGRASADEQWLADARRLLEVRSLTALNLHRAARQLGMSYDHFRQKFTKLAGCAPKQHADRHIIARACERLLSGREKSVAIAAELGFSDEYHFSKRFREVMGMPPRAFRRLK